MYSDDDPDFAHILISLEGGQEPHCASGIIVYLSRPPVDQTPFLLLLAGTLTADRRIRLGSALDRLRSECGLPWEEGLGLILNRLWVDMEDHLADRFLFATGRSDPPGHPLWNPGVVSEFDLAERSIFTGTVDAVAPVKPIEQVLGYWDGAQENIIAHHEGDVRSYQRAFEQRQDSYRQYGMEEEEGPPTISYRTIPPAVLSYGQSPPRTQRSLEPRFSVSGIAGIGPLDVPRPVRHPDGRVSFSIRGPVNLLQKDGKRWRIRVNGVEQTAQDVKGLRYLHTLISRPGVGILALDLVQEDQGHKSERGAPAALSGDGLVSHVAVGLDLSDERAKAEYKQRLEQIEEELELARASHDDARELRLESERDALARQLQSQFDVRGRPRQAGSPVDRARTSVQKAIQKAIEALEEPARSHLQASIKTGTYCAYKPSPDVKWEF